MKKVVLVDGNNLIFRAYHATAYTGNLMRNSKGLHTNALYGFVNMMNKILREENPDHILVAFDKGKTFRHESYEGYKATRKKIDDELIEQFPYSRAILDGMGIKWLEVEGYEADDIIGTFSNVADNYGYKSVIISSDKDMLQLISNHTKVKLISKGDFVLYDEQVLLENKGVTPSQIRDMKGLEGDKSDNIPGVPGVGEKTALKLLNQYKNIEGIYEHIEEIKGKLKEKLENSKELAFMSKELATIREDIPLSLTIEDTLYNGLNYDELLNIYDDLEFYSLIKKVQVSKNKSNSTEKEVIVLESIDQNLFTDGSAIYVEIENDNYHKEEILGIGLYNEKGSFYIPFDVFKNSNVDLSKVKNIKTYDLKKNVVAFKWTGMEFGDTSFDLMLGAYLLNPNIKNDFGFVALEYGYDISFKENVYGKGRKYAIPEIDVLSKYVCQKAKLIYDLEREVTSKLEDNNQLYLFKDIELPLARILGEMEFTGINIDVDFLEKMGNDVESKLEELTNIIYDVSGEKFNIASPKQLGVILFDKLGIKYPAKRKEGKSYSTSVDILNRIVDKHEIVGLILEYRKLAKIKSTYIDGLLKSVFEDNKVHTIFQQAYAVTGRLSSIEPNIQNIPIRTEIGKEIRKAFISSPGHLLLACDYSQIELRVLAHISKASNLIEAFNNDMDVHTKTAMDLYGVDETQVTSNMRRNAKAVNFGIVYGISSYGLSQNIDVSVEEANKFINEYNEKFPGVKKYMDEIVEFCKEHGYVETIMKRRRYIPDINSSNFMQRSFASRTAMNTPIQGSAADIIKKAMIDVDSELKKHNLKSKMIVQVHDELIFDVLESEMDIVEKIVVKSMENTIQLDVNLKVDYNKGDNWYESK